MYQQFLQNPYAVPGAKSLANSSTTALGVWHVQSGFYTKSMAGPFSVGGTQCVLRLHDVSDGDSNVTGELVYDDVAT